MASRRLRIICYFLWWIGPGDSYSTADFDKVFRDAEKEADELEKRI